jgi:hypothetical protein
MQLLREQIDRDASTAKTEQHLVGDLTVRESTRGQLAEREEVSSPRREAALQWRQSPPAPSVTKSEIRKMRGPEVKATKAFQLGNRLSRLAAGGTLWWAVIGFAGVAQVQSAPELWHKMPGMAAMLWAATGIAILARAAPEYQREDAGYERSWEPDLADLADVTGTALEAKTA